MLRKQEERTSTQITLPLVGLLVLLIIWELSVFLRGSVVVPAPSSIPLAFLAELQSGILLRMVFLSLRHYILGVLLGSCFGILLGIVLALSPTSYTVLKWIIRSLRPIPPLAWIPFAIIWFGITEFSAAFIISIGVFWINFFASYGAVRAVDPDLMEVAAIYAHNSFFDRLFRVIIPASMDGIMNGIRASIGQGWMTVIAAELFGIAGIGQRMLEASGLLAIEVVAVYMITISILYGLSDACYVFIRRKIMLWEQL